jgi:RNA polymerase sigma-70 factor, ECF subfamily
VGPLQRRQQRPGPVIDGSNSLGYHIRRAQVPITDPDDHLRVTEALVEAAWRRQDFKTAATLVLESFGAELYSFVLAQFHHSWDEAEDAFSMFREDLWRGLPSFQWRCSVRAWSYQLARHAVSRYRRSPQNRRARHVSLEDSDFLSDAVERARTTTQVHLRSEIKTEIQKLRNELTQEERDLLALRIDRNLSWREVAHAMLPDDETPDEQRLRRLESSLRQRFVELKKRLKQLAIERGIL